MGETSHQQVMNMHADQSCGSEYLEEPCDPDRERDARAEFQGESDQSIFASVAALERLAQLLLPETEARQVSE